MRGQRTRRYRRREGYGARRPPWSRCSERCRACRSQGLCSDSVIATANEGPRSRTLDALEVLLDRLVEEKRVALVEGIDLSARLDLNVRVRQDELANTLGALVSAIALF